MLPNNPAGERIFPKPSNDRALNKKELGNTITQNKGTCGKHCFRKEHRCKAKQQMRKEEWLAAKLE